MYRHVITLLATLCVATACSGADKEEDTDTTDTSDCGGSLSLDVDDSPWTADLEVCGVIDNGIFNVTGSDNDGNQAALTVMNAAAGTFSLDGTLNGGRWNEVTQTFLVTFGGTPGTVTFDSFDDMGASGTFSFLATDATTSETRDLTEGRFDVTF